MMILKYLLANLETSIFLESDVKIYFVAMLT